MLITIDDVRRAGYCASGARAWFRARGMNFADFLKNGMDSEDFLEQGDELAQTVVDKKIERENG